MSQTTPVFVSSVADRSLEFREANDQDAWHVRLTGTVDLQGSNG